MGGKTKISGTGIPNAIPKGFPKGDFRYDETFPNIFGGSE